MSFVKDNSSFNGFQWLRLVTPILVSVCLFYVRDIRTNTIKIEERVRFLENRMIRIETILRIQNGERKTSETLPDMPKKPSYVREVGRVSRLF